MNIDYIVIGYTLPQLNNNPDIVYSDEMDMNNKFNNYILNHNKKWSSVIKFTRIHYAILITNSVYMERNTPVMNVIKNNRN